MQVAIVEIFDVIFFNLKLAQEFNIPWFETSAYTGDHVEDVSLLIYLFISCLFFNYHSEEVRGRANLSITVYRLRHDTNRLISSLDKGGGARYLGLSMARIA